MISPVLRRATVSVTDEIRGANAFASAKIYWVLGCPILRSGCVFGLGRNVSFNKKNAAESGRGGVSATP